MSMKLENIAYEEIEPFFNSLGKKERELFGIPLTYILCADYVCGVRVGGDLVGIGGYLKSYGFIPSSFDVIASLFQGNGLGNELHKRRLEFARKHYSYAVTILGDPETHQASMHLCYKHGLKDFYRKGHFSIAFNLKGKIICKTIPFIYSALYWVYHLPFGVNLFKTTYGLILKRRSNNNSTE